MSDERTTVADYIRRAAQQRGIDPDIALRVFKQESGFNPAARNITPKEESYGVAQLNVRGGLGVEARKRGIEPSDASQWPRHVDFALDTVAKDGWRQWYGARDVGIGRWQGVSGAPQGADMGGAPAAPYAPPTARMYPQVPDVEQESVAGTFANFAPAMSFGQGQSAPPPPPVEQQPDESLRVFAPRTTRRKRA